MIIFITLNSPFSDARQLLDLRHHLRDLELQPLRKKKQTKTSSTAAESQHGQDGRRSHTHFNIVQKLLFPASYVGQLVSLVVGQVFGNWRAGGDGQE